MKLEFLNNSLDSNKYMCLVNFKAHGLLHLQNYEQLKWLYLCWCPQNQES